MAKPNTSTKHDTRKSTAADPATALWRIVLTDYEREVAAYAIVEAEYTAACRAADAECPTRDEEFKVYGLTHPRIRRQDAIAQVDSCLAERDNGQLTSQEQAGRDTETLRIVSDYFDYYQKRAEVMERIYRPAEEKHDVACDLRRRAWDKVIGTPAPDAEALLLKLDLLTDELISCDDEDAERLDAIRQDARRLLGAL
jgi:hypothetical protein